MMCRAINIIKAPRCLEQKTKCSKFRNKITNRTCKTAILKMYLVTVLIVVLMPLSSIASHDPWGENLQPKLHTDYLNEYSGKKIFYIFSDISTNIIRLESNYVINNLPFRFKMIEVYETKRH